MTAFLHLKSKCESNDCYMSTLRTGNTHITIYYVVQERGMEGMLLLMTANRERSKSLVRSTHPHTVF